MANIPENTTYNKNGTQSPLANLSSITKLLQKNAQKTSSDSFQSALMSHYNPETFSRIFGAPTNPNEEFAGFPTNTPVAPTTPGLKNEPIPFGYNQFVPDDEGDKWTSPTNQSTLRNWPETLGGGQYITDSTKPGEMIKSFRQIMERDVNPGAKQKILGKLSSKLFQVDHIVPLWLGGADTLQNLQVLDNPTHEKKTAVQSVPFTLLVNKKISLDEAKLMALSWKDKDASGLPKDQEGYQPIDIAQKYAQKWKEQLANPEPVNIKSVWKNFPEAMSKFGEGWLPDVVREPIKGFVGGATAGIVPGTGPSEDSGKLGTVGNVVGNIAGTIWGLGKFAKLGSWGLRGTMNLVRTKKAVTLADEAMKTAGLATDIGNLSAQAISAKKRAEVITRMAKTAGLLSIWGQVGLSGREVTGQQDAEFKNHMTQFFTDVAFGGLIGASGQTARGYATVGLGTAALSLIEGEEIVPALQNAGIMTALHGMGYKRGMLNPKMRIGNEEAYKMAAETFNTYGLGNAFPVVKKGQLVPEILKLDIPKIENMRLEFQKQYPNDQVAQRMGPITNEAQAIDFGTEVARRRFGNMIPKSDGTISPEQIQKEIQRITTSANQLKNQTLPLKERQAKEWEDLLSMGEQLKPQVKSDQLRPARNKMEIFNTIPRDIPTGEIPNPNNLTFPVGKGGSTGYGNKIDPESKANIDAFARDLNNERYDGKIYIPKTDQTSATISRLINHEYQVAGKPQPIDYPERTLRQFIRTKDGTFEPAGFVPEEKSYTKKENLNKTYYEITNRLRHTIETAKSPEELKRLLEKDKSQIFISETDAQKLFDRKSNLKNIPDEELYSILKPSNAYDKLNQDLNNSAIWKKMDELGIDYLVVDPYKAWEADGMRPRRKPDEPYLNIDITEQDWLRSMAIKSGELGAKKTAVQPFVEQKSIQTPEAKKVSATINKITKSDLNEVKAPKQSTLPLETPRGVPVLAPKSPVEALKPVKTTLTPPEVKIAPKALSEPKGGGVIQDLFKRGKITPEEAAVYGKKEQRFSELSDAIANRNLEYTELKEFTNLSKDLNLFLQAKGIIRTPPRAKIDFRTDPQTVIKNKNSLLEDALLKAESDFESLKSKKATNDPDSLIDALGKISNSARSIVVNNKLNLTGIDQKELIKSFDDRVQNMIFKYADTMFEGTTNVKGMNYDTKYHQYVGKDPDTGREVRIKHQTMDQKAEKIPFETNDQKLAKTYGLELKEDGYLKLDRNRQPMFSEAFLKTIPKAEKQSPINFWGKELVKDLKVNEEMKTIHSENFMKELDIMEKSPSSYSLWGEMINKGLKKIIVDPQEPWLKKLMQENAGKSFTFNSLMKPNSSYIRRMFQTTNRQGHPISQPVERIIKQVEGASPQEIKDLDLKTLEAEQLATERRVNRGDSETIKQENIISENISPEDLKGMSIKDTAQIEKVQDLTNFELRFPSLIYEELTGRVPPREAIANDAVAALKDFISNYSPNIKKGGKIKKVYIDNAKWEEIKKELLGKKIDGQGGPYDGKGGPYDGQGGMWGSIGNFFKNPLSSFTKYEKPKPSTYNVRGVNIGDADLTEAGHILFGEISNRTPDRQQFEVRNAVNTAINRATNNPKRYGGSLTKVLQEPAQYQSYAPSGLHKGGQIIESQYQRLKRGEMNEIDKKKLETIMSALNEIKTGNFADTTQGKTFYVHASDGTMWLGKTQKEAKNLANKHEKSLKKQITNWRTVPGLPAEITRR